MEQESEERSTESVDFALIKRYRKVLAKYKKTHVEVEQAYRNAFDEMKTTKFWKEYLHI